MRDDDYKLLGEMGQALVEEPMNFPRYLLYILSSLMVIFLLWAGFSEIDLRVRGVGKVIPSRHVQKIQHLEDAIISKIFVKDGDLVQKGEVLIKLDNVRYKSLYKENLIKANGLRAKIARLKAEEEGMEAIVFPEGLAKSFPNLVNNERKLFVSNREEYFSKIEFLQQKLDLAKESHDLAKPLADDGTMSRLEFIKIEEEYSAAKGGFEDVKKNHIQEIHFQLVEASTELNSLTESLAGLRDKIVRSEIQSPAKGTVKNIIPTTIGGVIRNGETIMEIVPYDDVLLVEAKVSPKDIAFIELGKKANIKISAYDYSIYGDLPGKVIHVSPDAILEISPRGREESYYKIIVQTEKNYIEYKGKELTIIPGMQATVDILTGKQTLLKYLMKPLIKARREALSEP